MRLYIDSTNNLITKVEVGENQLVKKYQSPRDQDVLGAVIEALDQAGVEVSEISSIEVNTGPGSFTGIRVGVSVAQAFSYGLGVSINGHAPGTTLSINYGAPPSITTPSPPRPSPY